MASLLIVLGTLLLCAAVVPPGDARAQSPPPPPTVKLPPGEEPVRLTRLDALARISGLEAEVAVTMTFFNPNGRVLEGELEFPLPDGGTVAGYALDVQGRLVDGVVVGKEKARVVLETEIRKGVDPGIIEHVRGNFFRTRLYPIPARGERTVRVTWVAPLTLAGGEAALHVPLPRTPLPALKLQVEVARGPVRPELGGFGNLTLTEWDDRWTAQAELHDVTPGDDLTVRLPRLPAQVVSVEQHAGEHYLSISDAPALPAGKAAEPHSRIAVAWDASGSRDREAVRRDGEFLAALLEAWPGLTVDLVVFRDRPEPLETFALKKGSAKDLLSRLEALPLDGGTDLAALDLRPEAASGAAAWLLFSDGFGTLGDGLPRFGGLPVHVVSSDSRRDATLLKFLAAATGGQFVDLAALGIPAAVSALANPQPGLLRVDAPAGALADVQQRFYPGSGRAVVLARLLADAEVTLVYGAGGKETARSTVRAARAGAAQGGIVARAWAAAQAAALSVFPERNAGAMLELARRFGLVTPGTSLIVLERLDQYLEHGIEPPGTWPEMREQYLAALKERGRREAAGREEKITRVLAWWRDRVAWWEKEYRYPKDFKFAAQAAASADRMASGAGMSAPMAAPPPAPMVRPSAAPPRAMAMAPVAEEAMAPEAAPVPGAAKSAGAAPVPPPAIAIKAWDPDTPYLAAMKAQPRTAAYAAYLGERARSAGSPAFFLDCAEYLLGVDRALGLRVLSNLAELKIDDAALLRVFAWRLREAGELDRAVEVLEKVRRLRPEEPQSHRDLALLLADRMERDGRAADGLRAAELLWQVVLGDWQRFAEVEVVALMELNRLLKAIERLDRAALARADFVDDRLRHMLDLDVRIVMSWDADNTDIDLHVVEPSGEEAFYGHNLTTIGGRVSRDITAGYGPEEYVLRRAMPGAYRIRCKYYGSHQQTLVGPATVTATVYTDYGRPGEQRQHLTLRLDKVKDLVDVGEIVIAGGVATAVAPALRLTRKSVEKLARGATRAAVEGALGAPERVDGGDFAVLVYRLEDGSQVRLGFGPGLLWARVVTAGAERELKLK